jgi:putative ABC transport system permease protein
LGCAIGLILAQLSILAIRKLPEGTIPRADAISIDWTILLILGGITIVAMVLTSLLPAILVARGNPQAALQAALQAASRGIGSRTVGGRLSGAQVIVEVTLSTVLLIGAGLLFHTLWNLEKAPLGLNSEHVTTFAVMPADAAGISTMTVSSDAANAPTSVATLVYGPMLKRMRTLPGVQDAALVSIRPLTITGLQVSFDILGEPVNPLAMTRVSAATSGYGRVLGTPIVAGRMIADSDTKSAPPVCAVSETFAKAYFPGPNPPQSAVGKQINLDGDESGLVQPLTIIGVLADQAGKTIEGRVLPNLLLPPEQIPTNTLFYPFLLKTAVTFVVKTRGDIPIADQIRELFHHDAPGYALDQFITMQQAVEGSTFSNRLSLYLVGSFAGLTIAMTIAGLYGVLLQAVNFRRREIGVRTAMGATRADIAWMILRRGAILVGIGLGLGFALALSTTRLVASFLSQVRSADPWAYAGVIFSTALVGLIASLIPAYKASCIPPTQALRED